MKTKLCDGVDSTGIYQEYVRTSDSRVAVVRVDYRAKGRSQGSVLVANKEKSVLVRPNQ